jgi:hypothetical protein
MVTEILLAVANTTATTSTQNNFDIGDYTGIVALGATAITFYLTYRHGTQSEQTRIARETWEKISENNHKFNEIVEKYKEQCKIIDEYKQKYKDLPKGLAKPDNFIKSENNLSVIKKELDRRCEILLDHIEYYAFLVIHKQIKGKFTSYYRNRVSGVYKMLKKTYEELFQTQDLPTRLMQSSKEFHPEIYTFLLEGRYVMKDTRDFLREMRQIKLSFLWYQRKQDIHHFLRKMRQFKRKLKY